MTLWIALLALIGISALLTWVLRRYALARSLMDVPNVRSSHTIPTPRGGGAAIVVTFLAILPVLGLAGVAEWHAVIGLAGGGAMVAIVGFLDDHGAAGVLTRLGAHFLAATWIVFWLPELPDVLLFGLRIDLGLAGYIVLTVFLVWVLNLYNFMDGIDGLAGVEAITVLLGGALLHVLLGQTGAGLLPLMLAAIVGGFLCWNFPPARIFMGDVGSGFLGIILGALLLQAAVMDSALLWAWLILLGVFMVDATFTLFRRMLRGDRIHEAHRTHAYQYASRRFESHRAITLAVLVINTVWLLPLACAAALGVLEGLVALILAYIPLVGLAIWLKAGQPERRAN